MPTEREGQHKKELKRTGEWVGPGNGVSLHKFQGTEEIVK